MDGPIIGLDLAVRYYFLGLLTVLITGVFVFLGVVDVVLQRLAVDRWEMPFAVRGFVVSACLFPLWIVLSIRVIPWQIRFQATVGGLDLEGLLSIFVSAFGFVCIVASMMQLRRTSGPGKKISEIGSKVLVIIYVFNFVALLSGYIKPE